MHRKTALLIVLIIALTQLCSCKDKTAECLEISTELTVNTETELTEYSLHKNDDLLKCNFYNEDDFIGYDENSEAYHTDGELVAGIVPHHLLAGNMIASFFKSAQDNENKIDTIIFIAPIHVPLNHKICTSYKSWDTPFGIAQTDSNITDKFVKDLDAEDCDEVVEGDHSVSSLIPFAKKYFPSANIASLLIAKSAGKDTADNVCKLLSEITEDENCLVVFSVDFSHYLKPQYTEKCDMETLDAVMSFDTEKISYMTNDNLDSPCCVSAFLLYCKSCGYNIDCLDHSNSLEIMQIPYTVSNFSQGITSYFIFSATN